MTDATTTDSTLDGAHRGRRMTWAEFYKMRPDRKPANDNQQKRQASKSIPSATLLRRWCPPESWRNWPTALTAPRLKHSR